MKRYFLFLAILASTACKEPARKLPYYDTADFTPKWQVPEENTAHRVRPFELTDQENRKFTEKDMDGRICVVDFFFTSCPGICPKMTKSMAGLQEEFFDDDTVLLLSHSVTPERDSVPVLKEYAADKHVNARRWRLLTGAKKEIYDLGRRFYFVEEDEGIKRDDDTFLHTENFILVDKQRRIRGIYNGLDVNSMQSLISDIRVLKME